MLKAVLRFSTLLLALLVAGQARADTVDVLDNFSASSISNTTAETDLVNVTIPGGTFITGEDAHVHLYVPFLLLNSTGSGKSVTFRIYVDGTKVYDDSVSVASTASGTAFRPCEWALNVYSQGALPGNSTISSLVTGDFKLGNVLTTPTTGLGKLTMSTTVPGAPIEGALTTLNWNSDIVVKVTAQLSANNPNLTIVGRWGGVMLKE